MADVTPRQVIDAFKSGQHVYVAPGADVGVDVQQVKDAATGHDVYVALLPKSVVTDAGSMQAVVQRLEHGGGASHAYVVATQDGFALYNPNHLGSEIYDEAQAQGPDHTSELVYAVEHADTQAVSGGGGSGGDGGGSGSGTWVVLPIVLLIAVVAVVARRRRNRAATADLGSLRADAQSELDSLSDDLLLTDPAGSTSMPGATNPDGPVERALAVAWSRHSAASAMLAGARTTDDVERARTLVAQGRAALEHAQRLRDGVPGESEVFSQARRSGGPDPDSRVDQPPRDAGRGQALTQYTPASYPGYGYGYYPGYGYGFFNYGGSFVTGMLAGELLTGAFGGFGGYDAGYGSGYDQGYDSGYDAGQDGDIGGGDYGGGDIGGGDWGGGGDVGGGDWGGGGGDGGGW